MMSLNKMNYIFRGGLLYFICLFGGCMNKKNMITLETTRLACKQIDYSDGINEEEAIAIARYFVLDKEQAPELDLKTAKVERKIPALDMINKYQRDYYCIGIRYRGRFAWASPLDWHVYVDAQNGKVLKSFASGHK